MTEAGFEFEMVAQGHQSLLESDSENRTDNVGRIEFVGDDRLRAATDCAALLILTEWD